jgi:hypothetical protein
MHAFFMLNFSAAHSKSSSVTLISHVHLIFVSIRYKVFHLTFYSEGIAIAIVLEYHPCTVGHSLKSTSTNGRRFTALSFPWQSPIQVLTETDVP